LKEAAGKDPTIKPATEYFQKIQKQKKNHFSTNR
jgi:hypothetical protein